MDSAAPSPYDHLDYRQYLGAWLTWKKERNPRFSHRMFARLAGDVSISLLHHVIDGQRNLTPATTEGFIKALGLRAGEAQFFRLLIDLDQAKDTEVRNRAWDQISATRRFREARGLDVSAFEYISNWHLPVIRELARRSDFRADPEWVAIQLRPQITVAEARRALEILEALGLLVRSGATLVAAEASVATAPEVSGLAFRNYHRGMLQRATDAIEQFPGKERHLLAVTVGVPASLLSVLKEESNAFLQRLMHLCDSSPEPVDRICQMNLQIFPLTTSRDPDAVVPSSEPE